MKNIIEMLNIDHPKIPSWKDDIVQNLAMQTFALPRKTHISGHFHLKYPIIAENGFRNKLIF